MGKIIIIGNGFDIDHGAKTSWNDIFDIRKAPWIKIRKKSDKAIIAEEEMIKEGNTWSDFEKNYETAIYKLQSSLRVENDLTNIMREIFCESMNLFEKHSYSPGEAVRNGILIVDFLPGNNLWIKETMIKYLINIQNEFTITKKEKYVSEFSGAEKIISFNYTSWYEGIYFSSKNIIYIHGKMEKDIPFNNSMIKDIKLGTYRDNSILKKPYLNSFYVSKNKKYANKILNQIDDQLGNKENDYNKKSANIKPVKKLKNISEIVFLGHSISRDDIDNVISKIRFNNKIIVKIYGYWITAKEKEDFIKRVKETIRNSLAEIEIKFKFIDNYKQ